MSVVSRVLSIVLDIALIAVLAYFLLQAFPDLAQNIHIFQGNLTGIFNTLSYSANSTYIPQNAIVNYTLMLINKDRNQYGLANVTLSPVQSGQQHADSMLAKNYFSHWDVYGMKPYMRYTLLGGRGAVSENIAYQFRKVCLANICAGGINVTEAVKGMEYSMLYNDSACCNNEHRQNILDPSHNQVSIGISYNGTNVYFDEDFIDSYINWYNQTPKIAGSLVSLTGEIPSGDKLDSIEIGYEPLPQNMSRTQLAATSSYSYGQAVAGVTYGLNYFPNITTIRAAKYYYTKDKFDIAFDMHDLEGKYGGGVYTLLLWLKGQNGDFVASTYSFFIDSQGNSFTPSSV